MDIKAQYYSRKCDDDLENKAGETDEEEEEKKKNCNTEKDEEGNGVEKQCRVVNDKKRRECSNNMAGVDDDGNESDDDEEKKMDRLEKEEDDEEEEEEEEDVLVDVIDDSGITVDRGRAWFVMISCFLMHLLVVGGGKSFGVFVQEFQDRFQVGARELGVINGISLMLMFCLSIFVNMLVIRFSARRVVIAGSLLISVGFVMTAFIPTFQWLYVTYGIITGLGYGLSFSPTVVMVGQWFHKYRSVAYGFSLSGSGIGSFVIPNLVRLLINEYSLGGCLLIMGALMLNVSICGLLLPPSQSSRRRCSKKKELVCDSRRRNRPTEEKNYYTKASDESADDLKEGESKHGLLKYDNSDEKNERNDFIRNSVSNRHVQHSLVGKNVNTEIHRVPEMKVRVSDTDTELGKEDGFYGSYHDKLHNCHDCHQRVLDNRVQTAAHKTHIHHAANLQLPCMESNDNRFLSKSSDHLSNNTLEFHFKGNNKETKLSNHRAYETRLNVSSPHLLESNTLTTKMILSKSSQNNERSKLSLNKMAFGFSYASNCDIAMATRGYVGSLSNMTSRSQELTPASQVDDEKEAPLFEWSLLRNPAFIMHLVSALLGFASYMNNMFMLADYASECGLSRDMAAMTLSVVGIVDTIGRLTFAPLSEVLCCSKRRAWGGALAAMGILNLFTSYTRELPSLMTYSVLFGYACGCFTCLVPVLCAEINGLEKLGSSFGLTTFGMGMALMVGPPMCGAIKDGTGSWDNAFITVGVMAMVAAILAFP